eukprot:m.36286 g.36286  ORF g.36286 m.36286 type:complete len:357 (-) comp9077_c0_seq2:1204-2274(-)
MDSIQRDVEDADSPTQDSVGLPVNSALTMNTNGTDSDSIDNGSEIKSIGENSDNFMGGNKALNEAGDLLEDCHKCGRNLTQQETHGCLRALTASMSEMAEHMKLVQLSSTGKVNAMEKLLVQQRERHNAVTRQLEAEVRRLEAKVRRLEGETFKRGDQTQLALNGHGNGGGNINMDSMSHVLGDLNGTRPVENFITIMQEYHVKECPQSQRGVAHDWSLCNPLLVHRAPGRELPLRRDPRKPIDQMPPPGSNESPWAYSPSEVDSRSPEFMYHPEVYKTTGCDAYRRAGGCRRGNYCAFLHPGDINVEVARMKFKADPWNTGTSLPDNIIAPQQSMVPQMHMGMGEGDVWHPFTTS